MPKLRQQLEVNGTITLPDVEIPVSGDLNKDTLHVQEIETENITRVGDPDQFRKDLAFAEEMVTIFLHESTNPNEEQYVFCAVNCEYPIPGIPWMKRGRQYTIARKFVANLATARVTNYTQPFAKETNDRANYMRPHSAVRYPFSVIEDKNPLGAPWLKSLMGQ